jgi:ArsR family transcriptional regulator
MPDGMPDSGAILPEGNCRKDAQAMQLQAMMLHALADPLRIRIVFALHAHAMHVTRLAETLQRPQSTVSRHLKLLRERGLVTAERDGQNVVYSLADPRTVDALNLLGSVQRDRLEETAHMIA